MPMKPRVVVAVLLLSIAGCERLYPNKPLPNKVRNDQLYTYHDRSDRASSDPLIIMSFSGGGMRAAALAYSVRDELAGYTYVAANGRRRSLLDDVQIVSSTSGGSVTAAYFALHGDGNRQEQLRPFVKDFI